MESIRKIRQAYHRDKKPSREIARNFHLSKNTVKKILRSDVTEQAYCRTEQPRPKLRPFEERFKLLLAEDAPKLVRHRPSAQLLFDELQREGFAGGYDSVRRFKPPVAVWLQPSLPSLSIRARRFSSTGAMSNLNLAGSISKSKLPSSGSATAGCRSVSATQERAWRWSWMPTSRPLASLAAPAAGASTTI